MVQIIEKGEKGDDTWVVHPNAGYVLKFKNVKQNVNLIRETSDESGHKLFINVCHCNELPNVMNDLDEEECGLALLEESGSYKVPISIGEVETSTDNHGETCQKIDLVVNSTYYYKRLDIKSEFYRQVLLLIMSEAIVAKYGIKLDPTKAIQLRNRKVVGELSTQRIRKQPTAAHVVDVDPETSKECRDADDEVC
ncbi:hypothetical protein L596_027518 [Steinernema carpocapsae]|uniref:PIH1 N-terminal domain-containing protein n=1 Tax=Steinernema carpocapsae TaxID=34508 RepID=A0A4U5LVQ9_STECR|nr:hypothetical protein L596_027518 [Steinernema carpocapsae]